MGGNLPGRRNVVPRLRELWAYRDIIGFLALRDIKVRYKQTFIGVTWVLLQPLATMLVFTIFFGKVAKIPTGDIPYGIWSFTGLVFWFFFAAMLGNGGNSLLTNQNLIKKIYFPRLVVPLATLVTSGVDLCVMLGALAALAVYYGVIPSLDVIYAPLFLMLLLSWVLGLSFWLSALNTKYRDVRFLMPFVIQLLMFSSPVVYPYSLIPQSVIWRGWILPARDLYGLNPMVSVLEGMRWSLLGGPPVPMFALVGGSIVALLAFIGGTHYFFKLEKSFSDIL
ncbi:MAG: ABC transporter permease [Pirellulales bacterium]